MRVRRGFVTAAAACALLSACVPGNGPARDVGPDTLSYTGVVVQAGTQVERLVVLEQDGAPAVRLTGELAPEIGRLAGGTVRVDGAWTATNGGSLAVTAYELLEIAGGTPVVGVVEDRAGELWLAGGEAIRVLGAPAELHEQVGARVWIVGERDGTGIRPQSYGVIAEP